MHSSSDEETLNSVRSVVYKRMRRHKNRHSASLVRSPVKVAPHGGHLTPVESILHVTLRFRSLTRSNVDNERLRQPLLETRNTKLDGFVKYRLNVNYNNVNKSFSNSARGALY